jgi:signal transduction histidine kinase/CheY-like chemotaxis protein
MYRNLADTQSIATTFSNIGLIQLNQRYYREAYENFYKSYRLFSKTDYKLGKMWALHNMGTAKLWLKEYTEAEEYYKQSLDAAEQLINPEGVLSNLNALSEVKAQTGEYRDAFYYYVDFTEMRDSIKSQETREKISELETLYNIESHEKQLNESLIVIRRQRAQTIAIVVILALISITSVVIYIAYRKKKKAEVKIYSHKLDLENVLVAKDRELETQKMERKIAEESDKLKSAFLANMSHELRTPMNAIIAFSNFLREPNLPQKKHDEYLDHITSAGDSLLRLIDDIIDIAKLEARQLKISIGPVNISRMLRELKKVFTKIKGKNNYTANLILRIDPHHDYIVNTDVLRIKQILSNLIENAFKYTKRGVIEFGVIKKEEGLMFFVRDTGIGIPSEKLEKIFDRFLQIDSELNRRFGGTGLGLAISKNLAELLGGKIWVESEEGKGSTFYVLIPANDFRMVEISHEPATSTAKYAPENHYDWDGKTILIAEDEELNYRVLDSCLKRTRAKLLRDENGKKAVELCQDQHIDLVLMDIQMPVMDGYEATQRIKSMNLNVPVIAQTSFAMANEKERCINAGCDDYVTKPLDLEKLLRIINQLFSKTH